VKSTMRSMRRHMRINRSAIPLSPQPCCEWI
jgi:hypothetical protein